MKKIINCIILILSFSFCNAQYSKEKLSDILTNKSQKTWIVNGVNTDRPEKSMTFVNDNSGTVENTTGKSQSMKWSLKSTDNIRWFITIGAVEYEIIVSYDKKGDQYVKLTHQAENKLAGYYEIKLTELKKK